MCASHLIRPSDCGQAFQGRECIHGLHQKGSGVCYSSQVKDTVGPGRLMRSRQCLSFESPETQSLAGDIGGHDVGREGPQYVREVGGATTGPRQKPDLERLDKAIHRPRCVQRQCFASKHRPHQSLSLPVPLGIGYSTQKVAYGSVIGWALEEVGSVVQAKAELVVHEVDLVGSHTDDRT